MAINNFDYDNPNPARQNNWAVRFYLNGQNMGLWDKKAGGAIDSEEVKYYGFDQKKGPISLGGRTTIDNITIQRLYDQQMHNEWIKKLIDNVGSMAEAHVVVQPRDGDKNIYGKALHYRGTLKRVSLPDYDSETEGPALIELEIIPGKPQWS